MPEHLSQPTASRTVLGSTGQGYYQGPGLLMLLMVGSCCCCHWSCKVLQLWAAASPTLLWQVGDNGTPSAPATTTCLQQHILASAWAAAGISAAAKLGVTARQVCTPSMCCMCTLWPATAASTKGVTSAALNMLLAVFSSCCRLAGFFSASSAATRLGLLLRAHAASSASASAKFSRVACCRGRYRQVCSQHTYQVEASAATQAMLARWTATSRPIRCAVLCCTAPLHHVPFPPIRAKPLIFACFATAP